MMHSSQSLQILSCMDHGMNIFFKLMHFKVVQSMFLIIFFSFGFMFKACMQRVQWYHLCSAFIFGTSCLWICLMPFIALIRSPHWTSIQMPSTSDASHSQMSDYLRFKTAQLRFILFLNHRRLWKPHLTTPCYSQFSRKCEMSYYSWGWVELYTASHEYETD